MSSEIVYCHRSSLLIHCVCHFWNVSVVMLSYHHWLSCYCHHHVTIGAYMVRCGAAQSKIGQAEKLLQEKGRTEFIAPLKAFLEIDIKNAMVR